MEQPHRVRAAPDAGDAGIGQAPLPLHHLGPGLAADDGVEVPHHHRVRMRTRHRADDVVRVVDVAHPVAHRLVERVLQGLRSGLHGHHLGAEELHAEDVGRLAFDVLGAHVDHAFEPEPRRHRGGRHAVLAGAGLRDDAGLAHPLREQRLAHGVVHLVRAGMVQVLALEVEARAADRLRPAMRVVQRRGPAHVVPKLRIQLGEEPGVLRTAFVGVAQLRHRTHQGLGDERAAVGAEVAALVGMAPDEPIFSLDVREPRHRPPPSRIAPCAPGPSLRARSPPRRSRPPRTAARGELHRRRSPGSTRRRG